jgi:hypothetical protein
MPPAFILSQDRTLHEILSCITYSFLVRRQSWFGIVFHFKACIHALHIRLEFAPRNIAIPTPSRQSHEPLIHSHSITAEGEQVKIEKLTLGLGIIRLELMTSTTSRWHSTAELYPFPCPHRERELTNPKSKGRETQRHYSWTTWSRALFSNYYGYENNGKIGFNCQLLLSKIGLTTDSSHSTWFQKSIWFSRSK